MNDAQYIRVRVKAGTRKERIQQVAEGVYTVEVKERAERGEANARVRELLAEALHVTEHTLRLVKGTTSPSKTYLLVNHPHHDDKC
jgi:uncharacterized protein YggU (UPF0235/DUF167 family)